MSSEISKIYHQKRKFRFLVAGILCAVLLALVLYSFSLSTFPLTVEKAYTVIYNHIIGKTPEGYMEFITDHIVMDLTLPRTLCAVFIGAALAICGGIMQSMTHNPLTDPYTMGISSAALFGVALAIAMGIVLIPGLTGNDAIMVNAFFFAMIPAILITVMTTARNLSSTMMVLIGIGIMYLFTAFSTFIKINAEAEKLEEIYEWSVGTLSGIETSAVFPLFSVCLMMILIAIFCAGKVNIISSGDQTARSLGENPVRIRVILFVAISVCVAVCVSFSGTIGFVGLVAPHIARLFTGNNNKVMLPASAIIGALMLLFSDSLVRYLSIGLPVGVITALIGSPLFIYFLYRQRKSSTF
ncbi:MAG: iron ABC transporter permease [Candidatus Methanomethylophilus sp.]|nr:iron ABC transporter permease [Methanomethylophilus sp.]